MAKSLLYGNGLYRKEMTKLTPGARDELLVRVDERTDSIIRELKDHNEHLVRINGIMRKHDEMITTLNTTVYGEKSDKGLMGGISDIAANQKKLIIIVAVIAAGVGGGVAEVIKLWGG